MPIIAKRKLLTNVAAYAPAAASGWTPASLGSALRLWIKADTGTSTTGGLIDTIADQSGNGFNLSSNTTHRPTLNATGYNSLPAIGFSASSDTYLVTGGGLVVSALSMGASSSWWFIGTMASATDSYGRAMAYLGNTSFTTAGSDFSATDSCCAILRNAGTNAVCMYQAALTAGASIAASVSPARHRFLMVFNGTTATSYIDNVAVASPPACAFTLGSTGFILLGGDLNGSGTALTFPTTCWEGVMAEALVTNTALSSGDRASLDAYAVARLGA